MTECHSMIDIVRKNTMVGEDSLVTLYHQARFCELNGIPGDFIECGTWKGGSVGLMALVNLKHSSVRRHIHLFDAFQEICEPDETVDGNRAVREASSVGGGAMGRLVPLKGSYDHLGGPGTIEGNKEFLEKTIGYDAAHLHYHKGWFQDTLPVDHDSIKQIAILRLDGDWYASTKVCLEYLFDKVVQNGFLIVDDYGTYEGCQKAVDEYLEKKGITLYFNGTRPQSNCRYAIVT